MKVFVEDLCQATELYCLTAAYIYMFMFPKIWLTFEDCHFAKEKTCKYKNSNKNLTKYIYAPYYVL